MCNGFLVVLRKLHSFSPWPLQVKYLNKGRHGTVILAFDKVGKEHVAIKLIDKAAAANKYVEREIKNQYKVRKNGEHADFSRESIKTSLDDKKS